MIVSKKIAIFDLFSLWFLNFFSQHSSPKVYRESAPSIASSSCMRVVNRKVIAKLVRPIKAMLMAFLSVCVSHTFSPL